MNKENQSRILGAVFSMTYSLYPLEMTAARNDITRRALALTGQNATEEQVERILFELHQSKYDLNPGCQCLYNNGYYPDDFTDNFRKLDRPDETGAAARALFQRLQTPNPNWDAALLYKAIRAIYNKEYEAEIIEEIYIQLT